MKTKSGVIVAVIRNRAFGFIREEDGSNLFFHMDGLIEPKFEELREGMRVEYMVVEYHRGKKAIGVIAK